MMVLLSTFIISLSSLVSVAAIFIDDQKLSRVLLSLLGLSSGALLGGALLHLLPEAFNHAPPDLIAVLILFSLLFFFIIETFFFHHHCHGGKCDKHSLGYVNLMGDALHNFMDGLIIAAGFLTSPSLGIATSIAIAFHEIPHEIGDFGVLVYAGFTKKQAIGQNLLVSLTAVLGGLTGIFIHGAGVNFETYLLPVAIGSFLYIALSDLWPEIRRETRPHKSLAAFSFCLFGICLMWLIKLTGII
jgi:zinc and cadmium transporter